MIILLLLCDFSWENLNVFCSLRSWARLVLLSVSLSIISGTGGLLSVHLLAYPPGAALSLSTQSCGRGGQQ